MRPWSPGAKDSCPQTACPVAGCFKGTAGCFLSSDACGNIEFSVKHLIIEAYMFDEGLACLVGHGRIVLLGLAPSLAEHLQL